MGRELQKKKRRSSIPKVRQRPKSKKVLIRSHPLIASKWDSKLTLEQNYRKLGLTSKLNSRTGGVEALSDGGQASRTRGMDQDSLLIRGPKAELRGLSEIEVERDRKTGAIRKVVGGRTAHNPLNDSLNDIEAAMDGQPTLSKGVVPDLEEQAAAGEAPKVRRQSRREQEWIRILIDKYGEDYEKMAWDSELNPYQQTAGDIKRRAKKWKQHQEISWGQV